MEKFINANGLDIFFRESGQGRPLVLLHGATDTHSLWDPFLDIWSKRYRVITPDSRGHGRTVNPTRELSYQLLADDLAGLIQELELTKPFIVGYSDGGQAVLDFGMRYSEHAGALVIGGAWYRFSKKYQKEIARMGFVEPGKIDWNVYQKNAPSNWEEKLRAAHLDPDPNYPRILLESLARLWWTPLNYSEAQFKQIKAPVLILIGEFDEVIPVEEATEMAELIPGADLAVIPGARHNDVLKPGGSFLHLMDDFFENLGSYVENEGN